MSCPHCQSHGCLRKKGYFSRKTGPKLRIARFFCVQCRRHSSEQTHVLSEGHRRPELNRLVYLLLSSGVSQRRTARLLGTTQTTVARKLVRLSRFAAAYQEARLAEMGGSVTTAVFDEMETFEHSKCKPLSIALAVEQGSRLILAAHVARMPAKGRLAATARRRYGYRRDRRRDALASTLRTVARVAVSGLTVKSDECPRYPSAVRAHLPGAKHRTFKGRRGCVVGQGELKAGGFDPLFSLNHSCAMFRDNLKRLSRRTWCTYMVPPIVQEKRNLRLESGSTAHVYPASRWELFVPCPDGIGGSLPSTTNRSSVI